MPFESRLALLAPGFCPLASGQLSSIGVLASGETAPSSSLSTLSTASVSTVTSTSTACSSTSAASSSTPPTTAAPTPSTTGTGDELVLTTVFTQPSGCDTGITAVPSWTSELWQNIVNPVPTLTLTSCYPSQFYYSAVATALLPPYSQLVYPKNWESYNVTETYLICCPSGYMVYAPNYHNNTDRPGLGAVCYSTIWPRELMDITSYDATALATTIYTSAGEDMTMVFATAFDGTLASVIVSGASTASSTEMGEVVSSTSTSTTTTAFSVSFSAVAASTSTQTSSSAALLRPYYAQPLCLLQVLLLIVLF